MKDKVGYIEVGDKKYPLCFNLNVLEDIQDEYGSLSQWGNVVENKDNGEPRIKDLKKGLLLMINEEIDMENESKNEKSPVLNSKQVGRIITTVGFDKIVEIIKNISVDSTQTENAKNE